MALFMILLFTFFFLYLLRLKTRTKGSTPTNWPVVGMLPAVFCNAHRLHDYITQVLNEAGGTFEFKGPALTNNDMLITCDPANIQHIFNKKFQNYPKGSDFKKIFDILGDGIFSSDFKLWELHRKATLALINGDNFYSSLAKTVLGKVDSGLHPFLDHFSENRKIFDMQDVLQRFAFDTICQFFLRHDPGSLSVDFPNVPCEKALGDALEPLLYRHIVPEPVWRIQRWLNVGKEKTLMDAGKAFDDFIYPHIALGSRNEKEKTHDVDVFKSFRKAYEASGELGFPGDLKQFLRDTFLGLLFAGRDSLSVTLTWLFYLLSSYPSVETKIRNEITSVFGKGETKLGLFREEECDKLVYLHAAICETLRLFPPVALENKTPIEDDVLPSGNLVRENKRIIVSFYSTGRMESVWGKDCMEFKPERWLLPGGGIKHESSFKFPAFNAGPRSCPGKKMSFVEMKIVAASIIRRFHVEVVEGHRVSPRDAIMLKAKIGLMVRLTGVDGSW